MAQPKIKEFLFSPLTSSAIYPCRSFQCELMKFESISCTDVCLLSDMSTDLAVNTLMEDVFSFHITVQTGASTYG